MIVRGKNINEISAHLEKLEKDIVKLQEQLLFLMGMGGGKKEKTRLIKRRNFV